MHVGKGFDALTFKQDQFDGLMDPLVMVDHFTMTELTFGVHAHAGMSAVSVLFEDSEGQINNLDSLGNNINLAPGDLYWLNAGHGAVHDEKPTPGSRIHALQVFVNVPDRLRKNAPTSLHVKATNIPSLEGKGYRVRVALGASNGIEGAQSPTLSLTILDAKLDAGVRFTHNIPAGHTVWLYPISGEVELVNRNPTICAPEGKAIALQNDGMASSFEVLAMTDSQFVIIEGAPCSRRFRPERPIRYEQSGRNQAGDRRLCCRQTRLSHLNQTPILTGTSCSI